MLNAMFVKPAETHKSQVETLLLGFLIIFLCIHLTFTLSDLVPILLVINCPYCYYFVLHVILKPIARVAFQVRPRKRVPTKSRVFYYYDF